MTKKQKKVNKMMEEIDDLYQKKVEDAKQRELDKIKRAEEEK